ncbi:MAG: phosphoribosylglycinamide formyltransferase [Candidatus Omnitrophota bacterium]|jgi:phosphoribosylglycinamide formyltransferase-1|nr:MAG: phosphoribosylglycinamide formyltransferase [Candidatus Omnitrophota bacterium]
MQNIAVLASGNGTNFAAIARAIKKGSLKATLALLVCDVANAKVIARAKRAGVKTMVIQGRECATKNDFETKIIQRLKEEKIDLIILAGFMRILSPEFVREYKNRIFNIHPSLLPSFKGTHGIKDAFEYGVKITGVTVHLVDEELDHGPIILQEKVKIEENDTLESLEKKIHRVEHSLYPKAVQLLLEGKITIQGRKILTATRPGQPTH